MSIKERLKVHRQIERMNREKLETWRRELTTVLTTKQRAKTLQNVTF